MTASIPPGTPGSKPTPATEFEARFSILFGGWIGPLGWNKDKARQIEAAIEVMGQRCQRLPTTEEIASQLNVGIEVYHQWQAKLADLSLDSLGTTESGGFDGRNYAVRSRDAAECPATVFERAELKRALAAAISGLPEVHQTVLSLHYRDELAMREIAKITGRCESGVFHIRQQAISRLRACMAKLWPSGGRKPPLLT